MTRVDIQSVQDSVQKGTLVELSSDYRTASAFKACLPEKVLCAMSATAFRQYILPGTRGEKQSRVEAICAMLIDALKMVGEVSPSCVEFKFHGEDGRSQSYPLKLEWFAPNKCWVILLPNEHLRAVLTTGQPVGYTPHGTGAVAEHTVVHE